MSNIWYVFLSLWFLCELLKLSKHYELKNPFPKRGKNKELEAKAMNVEKQYLEEKAAREDAEATVSILKKKLMECRMNESASNNNKAPAIANGNDKTMDHDHHKENSVQK